MRNDVRKVYEYAVSLGFEEVRYTGHYHMRHPSGAQVTFSGTPRDRRFMRNAKADIKRALRNLNAQEEGKTTNGG